MKISDVIKVLHEWAPPTEAESYDNVGLITGSGDWDVNGILINLDVTEDVITEASSKGVNLIITHHPIWFSSRKRLNGEDYVSRIIIQAIKQDIALFAIHTNLDNVRDGVNGHIASLLKLKQTQFLKPKSHNDAYGSGIIGSLPQSLAKEQFFKLVKDIFKCGGIRYADAPIEMICKVAVCGGSGSFLTREALLLGAEAFVTSDITYHKFFDNENKMILMDIGHYESEQYTSELIFTHLSKKIPNFAIHLSEVITNPVRYYS